MPPHLHADTPDSEPSEPGRLDALITQTQRLRGELDAVRRQSEPVDGRGGSGVDARWQRALCELAAQQLADLGGNLDQLREGLADEARAAPPAPEALPHAAYSEGTAPSATVPYEQGDHLVGRVGSAEWKLLTDEVHWSAALYRIFGRTEADGPLSLDELPSWVRQDDQPALAAAFTACLVDGRPVDHEFRIARPDGSTRTVHLLGEPVLTEEGTTASMWAVVKDVTRLRRTERAAEEHREQLRQEHQRAQTERRLAVELQETVLPPWRGSVRFPQDGEEQDGALDLAARYLPSATRALIGGDWYDAMELPDGATLLTAGDLTGHGVAATSGMALLLGAVRGMAVAKVRPGALMGHLNQLLDSAAQPALGSAVCCRYEPATRTLAWAQAGHPAPLLFRGGTGRALQRPEGVLLGVATGATYEQRAEQLAPGDVLILHTDGLAPRSESLGPDACGTGAERLLALAPRFAEARTAQECVRAVAEEFEDDEREDDACVLVARVSA